jgi:hypothetical protein
LTVGTALVSDFDGTLVALDIDWASLRRELEVSSILDLWQPAGPGWSRVTEAEVRASTSSPIVPVGFRTALDFDAVAILTNNSEAAVAAFLARFPDLASRVVAVMGRESLGGPKNDQRVFSSGIDRLTAILGPTRSFTYMGDQDYELEFASRYTRKILDVRPDQDQAPKPG